MLYSPVFIFSRGCDKEWMKTLVIHENIYNADLLEISQLHLDSHARTIDDLLT